MNVRNCFALICLLSMPLLFASGCSRSNAKAANRAESPEQWSDELFSFAVANLDHLEDNDPLEMSRSMQKRFSELQPPRGIPPKPPANALLASWPEPDMLRQIVGRLNQWVDTLAKPQPWTPDAMVAGLRAKYGDLPMVADLDAEHFTSYDGYALVEADWARDVSRWAKGDARNDLEVARNLFDWTVRNIQADEPSEGRIPQVPWESLFWGHATAAERAWVYILLLRQCDIDAAIVALPEEGADISPPNGGTTNTTKPGTVNGRWWIGVVAGEKQKKLYLFEPNLGVPIPTAKGIVLDKTGQLDVEPASLDEVVADPKLLDRLSLGTTEPYWKKAPDFKKAAILLEASPVYLEPRAKRMEEHLSGDRKLVLSAEPAKQAERLSPLLAACGIGNVRPWELPYTTLRQRMAMSIPAVAFRLDQYFAFIGFGSKAFPPGALYRGRILHLKGRFFDEKGAIAYYQRARPRTREVLGEEGTLANDCYNQARMEELQKLIKTGRTSSALSPQRDMELKRDAATMASRRIQLILRGKLCAAYWLGLIEYEQSQYDSAIEYFVKRTLQAGRDREWATGAHYNVGRCEEAKGDWQDAVREYREHYEYWNRGAFLLRARWLEETHPEKKPSADKKAEKAATGKGAKDLSAEGKKEKPGEKKVEAKKPDGQPPATKGEEKKADSIPKPTQK